MTAVRDPAAAMDRMYRHQRHVYDLTRKFYLLGRDRLIRRLALRPGERICEVGCGTGRNLLRIARAYPEARLYGLDASAAMLTTAGRRITAAGLGQAVVLRQGLARELDHAAFGAQGPFDRILFSYTLSMIPDWPAALDRAAVNLQPGGGIGVVDFGDLGGLPEWTAAGLRRWLQLFGVAPPPGLPDRAAELVAGKGGAASALRLFGGYAVLVEVRTGA